LRTWLVPSLAKRLFQKYHPKKTWEGTLGGFVLCIAVMGTLGSYVVTGHMS
jgi:CDP-diglyceride synthetase